MGISSDRAYKKQNNLQSEKKCNAKTDKESENAYDSIPKDQYLCPFCGEIPELLNIHTDNGYVEFRCKKDKDYLISVKDYFNKLSESKFTYYNTQCDNCNKFQKSEKNNEKIFKYCYLCKTNLCNDCLQKQCNNEQGCSHNQTIPINEKNTRCLTHYEEGKYTSFCHDCHVNICQEFNEKVHRKHRITNFFRIETQKNVIIEKNKILKDIIRFNELILNTYEKFPDNYFHQINISNLVDSIKVENSRNSNDLNFIFDQLKMKLKNREEAIKTFNKKFKMCLNGQEEILALPKKGLKNEDLKTISQIGFSKLKVIDISENSINDISCFKDINMLNVEHLKMNDNQISDLDAFKEINAPKLEILELQNNKFKTVGPLLKNDFPSLKLLRIEHNDNLDETLKEFNQFLKKYTKKLIYKPYTFEDFNKKYDCEINKNSAEINLTDSKLGNEILRDLFILSTKYENTEKLVLSHNNIDDISILSKMHFNNLKTLDLSLNQIKSIRPLSKMRLDNLKQILFQGNNTSDFTSLTSSNFKNLKYIDISENNIVEESSDLNNIVNSLNKKKIEIKF